jgi:tetratricopeptide (TPR) repeat protein
MKPEAAAMLERAKEAIGRRDTRTALALAHQVLTFDPDLPEAFLTLGRAYQRDRAFDAAIEALQRAIELAPLQVEAYAELAFSLGELGNFHGALDVAKRAIALDPNHARTHFAVGLAMAGLEQPIIAGAALRRAILIDPDLAPAHDRLGCLLQIDGDWDGAIACYRRAIELDSGLGTAHYRLGTALHHHEDFSGAMAAFRAAIVCEPRYDAAWNALGSTLGSLGRFEEAGACFRRALEINPESGAALHNLAKWQILSEGDAALHAMACIADNAGLAPQERLSAAFALGKALDDAGRYDEAFERFCLGNAILRGIEAQAGDRFDGAVLAREIEARRAIFTPAFFTERAGWGIETEVPVYVVGLFRSGTTLVEQIAASHARVHGAGELDDMRDLAARLLPHPEAALAWTAALVRETSAAQAARLGARAPGAARIIDKNPNNIFGLGLVATLFPRARIVFCRREPRDAALSCYMQALGRGQTFASDLADCARRWVETERLAKIWRACLPNPMIEIQYETLVGDLEGESRRLIDFLGLDWDPACLKFHETERAVRTASSWQVRQPLYTSSIGRWRHYARHLGPMLDVFRENGIVLD